MDQNDPEMAEWLKKEKREERLRARVSAGLEQMAISDFNTDVLRAVLALSGLTPAPQPVRISALSKLDRHIKERRHA